MIDIKSYKKINNQYRLVCARCKGFTLIELLIVISIVGVLSSIVLVSLGHARDRAFSASFKSAAASLVAAAAIECEGGSGLESVMNINLADVDAIDEASIAISGISIIDSSYTLSDCNNGDFVIEAEAAQSECSVLAIREGVVAWGDGCQ